MTRVSRDLIGRFLSGGCEECVGICVLLVICSSNKVRLHNATSLMLCRGEVNPMALPLKTAQPGIIIPPSKKKKNKKNKNKHIAQVLLDKDKEGFVVVWSAMLGWPTCP